MSESEMQTVAPASGYSPVSDRTPVIERETVAAPERAVQWSLAKRVGFRFAFAYILLYTFPGPIDELRGTDVVSSAYASIWRPVVPWVGANVLHLANPINMRPSGSGDRMFNWVDTF